MSTHVYRIKWTWSAWQQFHIYLSKVLTDQPGRCQIFRKYKIVKHLKKSDNKTDDYSSFKITKIYLQKKSLYNCFAQNIERTLSKHAPSILPLLIIHWFWMEKGVDLLVSFLCLECDFSLGLYPWMGKWFRFPPV